VDAEQELAEWIALGQLELQVFLAAHAAFEEWLAGEGFADSEGSGGAEG
jgi:hypothetical protein